MHFVSQSVSLYVCSSVSLSGELAVARSLGWSASCSSSLNSPAGPSFGPRSFKEFRMWIRRRRGGCLVGSGTLQWSAVNEFRLSDMMHASMLSLRQSHHSLPRPLVRWLNDAPACSLRMSVRSTAGSSVILLEFFIFPLQLPRISLCPLKELFKPRWMLAIENAVDGVIDDATIISGEPIPRSPARLTPAVDV